LKILLDHNLDRRLKQYLTSYETATAQEQGWADLLNGELLDAAESNGFSVLLTADANIKNQQNISARNIAVIVLRASNNRLVTHVEMVDQIYQALSDIQPSQILEIFHPKLSNQP
jgi:predicted nuclease of predicted toxin-antitoxin system